MLKKTSLPRHSFVSSLSFYLKSSQREISRRKTFYCLALLSCTLVVMATAVSQSVVNNAPLVFLRQAERTSGKIDVEIMSQILQRSEPFTLFSPAVTKLYEHESPTRFKREILLNGTRIEQINQKSIRAHSAYRYQQKVQLIGGKGKSVKCQDLLNQNFRVHFETLYDPEITKSCHSKSANLLILNTTRESEIGLGKGSNASIPEGCAIIDRKTADLLDVKIGDYFMMQFYIDAHLEYIAEENEEFFKMSTTFNPQDVNNIFARFMVRVHGIQSDFADKVPGGGQNYILMEQESFYPYVAKHFSIRWTPILKQTLEFLRGKMSSIRLADYSNSIIFNHPQRMKIYTESNFDNLLNKLEDFAEKISLELGILPFHLKLELIKKLEPLKFATLFLGLILNIVILVLFGQSVMVFHNLLLVKVETKSFEMGVLRTLGLSKIGIIELILAQTLLFVLPAIVLGLLFSIPFLKTIGAFLRAKLETDVDTTLSIESISFACMIGFFVPIISSITPIVVALEKPLNAALDTVHSKATAVLVDIQVDSKKIPWNTLTFSSLTITFGSSIYYLLPFSLYSLNFGLLLSIFVWILLGMLVGLVLLSI